MSLQNLRTHRDILINCLYTLPRQFLDCVEYGTDEIGEFAIRYGYAEKNVDLSREERREALRCKKSTPSLAEIKSFQRLKVLTQKEVLEECAHALEQHELREMFCDHCCASDIPKDAKEAFEVFKRAAEMGIAKSMVKLGKCYENGIGTPKDQEQAAKLYQQATDLKCADAVYNLGRCYYNGIGVAQDKNKAFELFQSASEMGCVTAITSLASFYETGIDLPKDEKKALELYQRASEMGDENAMFRLCLIERGADTSARVPDESLGYNTLPPEGDE